MKRIAARTGRKPRPAAPGRRASLGLKVTPEIKNKLDAAAKANGRTQSQEAELRLENSFRDEGHLLLAAASIYGPAAAVALEVIGRTVVEINRDAPFPETWIDAPNMVEAAAWAAATVFAAFGLEGGPLDEALSDMQGTIVAPTAVGALLGAVKAPDQVIAAELREWAKPLHAILGAEIAARLSLPQWVEDVSSEPGEGTAIHPASLAGKRTGEPTED